MMGAMDGNIEGNKLRLMTKGLTRRAGVEFFQILNPVDGLDTMPTIFAVSASNRWGIKALGFQEAHLNAPLAEKTWLDLSSGEVAVQACKTIHELRQSAMEW